MSGSSLKQNGLALVLTALSVCVVAARPWQANTQTNVWTQPQLIFEGRGLIDTPSLVADAYGRVHAFWIFTGDQQTQQRQQGVYYTRLDQPTWPVNDIFFSAARTPSLKSVMTRTGLALLWNGNQLAMSGIAPEASAQDWAGPSTLDPSNPESGLAVDGQGTLWRIYGSSGSNEIMVQRLNPDTHLWEPPRLVGDTVNPDALPDGTRLAISADGTLHAVWAEYKLPNGWPPVGLYYSQSTDGGQTWSARHKIAGANFNQPNVITGPGQRVYVAWTGTAGAGMKHFEESLDGGRTWQNEVFVMKQPGGGSEGAPNLAIDGAGNVHMVFSHNGCVWHASRVNNIWSEPECVSAGVSANALIEAPAFALGLGNQLHVLFWTDRHQIWYTSLVLSIPGQQPLPTPTFVVPTVTAVVPTIMPGPTRTPLPDYGPLPAADQANAPGFWALGAGLAPVVMLVLVVVAVRRRRTRR